MRVYRNRYYILRSHPGISGFQRWDEYEYRVCTGHKARNHKEYVVREFLANGRGLFRLEDGHLPDYQPHVKEKEIYDFLDNEPYQTAFILNPEVYNFSCKGANGTETQTQTRRNLTMKQKTIRLDEGYRINGNGNVEALVCIPGKWDYEAARELTPEKWEWISSRYQVGVEVMLVSNRNVSPNALRGGEDAYHYSLVFDRSGGIGGNLNPNCTKYHGWRGTTNDISCTAHGLRKIMKIRELQRPAGVVAVTVGPDLYPEEP